MTSAHVTPREVLAVMSGADRSAIRRPWGRARVALGLIVLLSGCAAGLVTFATVRQVTGSSILSIPASGLAGSLAVLLLWGVFRLTDRMDPFTPRWPLYLMFLVIVSSAFYCLPWTSLFIFRSEVAFQVNKDHLVRAVSAARAVRSDPAIGDAAISAQQQRVATLSSLAYPGPVTSAMVDATPTMAEAHEEIARDRSKLRDLMVASCDVSTCGPTGSGVSPSSTTGLSPMVGVQNPPNSTPSSLEYTTLVRGRIAEIKADLPHRAATVKASLERKRAIEASQARRKLPGSQATLTDLETRQREAISDRTSTIMADRSLGTQSLALSEVRAARPGTDHQYWLIRLVGLALAGLAVLLKLVEPRDPDKFIREFESRPVGSRDRMTRRIQNR